MRILVDKFSTELQKALAPLNLIQARFIVNTDIVFILHANIALRGRETIQCLSMSLPFMYLVASY